MGLESVTNYIDKSLFDATSQSSMAKPSSAYSITISPTDGSGQVVTGLMLEGISLGISPEYDDSGIGSVVNNIGVVSKFKDKIDSTLAVSGKRLNASGFVTRKFYTKSGYLEINPSFRIVNWNGDGKPMLSTLKLMYSCLPKSGSYVSIQAIEKLIKEETDKISDEAKAKIEKATGALGGVAKKVGKKVGKVASEGLQVVGDVVADVLPTSENLGRVASKLGKDIGSAYSEGSKRIKDAEFELTSSPPTVVVTIGQYFKNEDMIIEDLSVEFSKEMTSTGPLYADIKLKLSSAEMLTEGNLGFRSQARNQLGII